MTAAPGFHLHPDVVWVDRPDGSSRLLHLDANTSVLDAHSTRLLRSILADGAPATIDALVREFGVPRDQVTADVNGFVAELVRERIVMQPGDRPGLLSTAAKRSRAAVLDLWLSAVDRPRRPLGARVKALLRAAHWSTARMGWAETIRAWEHRYPQPHAPASDDTAFFDALDQAVRRSAAGALLPHECKERALTCLALARGRGFRADLVLGLTYLPLRAHVWVECGDRIVSDDPEMCRHFEPVRRYRGGAGPTAP